MSNQKDLLKEFDEYYHALKNSKDPYFSDAFKYFNFIKDKNNYPLYDIARSILSSPPSKLGVMINVKSAYENNVFSSPSGTLGISMFHSLMVKNAKRLGITKNEVVTIHTEDNRVCRLIDKEPVCYPIKRKESERFKIIILLFDAETGKSAREIAERLKYKTDSVTQGNIKKEIIKINEMFQNNCNTSEELISHTTQHGKNVYFLNRKDFLFRKEK